MKTVFLTCLLSCLIHFPMQAQSRQEIDSLLNLLDCAIAEKKGYEAAKMQRIDSLERLLEGRIDDGSRFRITSQLIAELRPFIYDAAHERIIENIELARKIGNRQWESEMRIVLSTNYLSGGLYHEAIENLKTIDRGSFSPGLWKKYYLCCEQVFHHMSMYARDNSLSLDYDRRSACYLDSVLLVSEPGAGDYQRLVARQMINRGRAGRAREIFEKQFANTPFGTHSYAMLASTLSGLCLGVDEGALRKKYLILSAVSDIISSVRENESLRNLSLLLFNEGDIERSYRYCTVSLEDANNYNSRLRRVEVAQTLPIIERAYQENIERQYGKQRIYLIIISFLCLAMLLLIALLLVLNKRVVANKNQIARFNRNLQEINGSLREANRVKEGYIGEFLLRSSFYISQLERYRNMVYSKLMGNKIDELKQIAGDPELINKQIKEFYQIFDKTFLKLYPDFIDRFNSLLRPGEQIVPDKNELLAPEMRIFALVKLGITDSSQIARFLRYSPSTVYSYRTKTRNRAVDRASFEADIVRNG